MCSILFVMNKVLVFGSVNIDRTFRIPHWIEKGETILSTFHSVQAGGKGANQAASLALAGADVALGATIGDDGRWIIPLLSSFGVDTSLIRVREKSHTGSATILVDENGSNSIVLYGGGNRENDSEYIKEVFSYYDKGDWIVLQNEINNLPLIFDTALKKGLKICFNPSPFEESLLSLPLEKTDLVILNEVEMGQLLEGKIEASIESYKDALLSASLILPQTDIILTIGDKGSLFKRKGNNEIIHQKAIKTNVVDTTAAGDTFLGYYLALFIEGYSMEEAVKVATKASSIAVSRPGAMDSIARREEVEGAKAE